MPCPPEALEPPSAGAQHHSRCGAHFMAVRVQRHAGAGAADELHPRAAQGSSACRGQPRRDRRHRSLASLSGEFLSFPKVLATERRITAIVLSTSQYLHSSSGLVRADTGLMLRLLCCVRQIAILRETAGRGSFCSLVLLVVVAKDLLVFCWFAVNLEVAATVRSPPALGTKPPRGNTKCNIQDVYVMPLVWRYLRAV